MRLMESITLHYITLRLRMESEGKEKVSRFISLAMENWTKIDFSN